MMQAKKVLLRSKLNNSSMHCFNHCIDWNIHNSVLNKNYAKFHLYSLCLHSLHLFLVFSVFCRCLFWYFLCCFLFFHLLLLLLTSFLYFWRVHFSFFYIFFNPFHLCHWFDAFLLHFIFLERLRLSSYLLCVFKNSVFFSLLMFPFLSFCFTFLAVYVFLSALLCLCFFLPLFIFVPVFVYPGSSLRLPCFLQSMPASIPIPLSPCLLPSLSLPAYVSTCSYSISSPFPSHSFPE